MSAAATRPKVKSAAPDGGNLVPLGDRVLVRRDEAAERQGTILLPDSAREKPARGTVLAVGEKVEGLAAGDRVYYTKYGGLDVPDHDDLLVMRVEDVLLREV